MLELLPARLALTVAAAFGAWGLVAAACRVLRIRDPRLRAALCGVGIADVVLVLAGHSILAVVLLRLAVPRGLSAEVLASAAPWTLVPWACGAALLVSIRTVRARRGARVARALAVIHGAPRDVALEVGAAARRVGVRAPAVAFISGSGTPFIAGIRGPCLVLPQATWEALDVQGRRAMLLHELDHVRRRDNAVLFGAGCLVDLLCFNWPFRRLVARFCRELEGIADTAAVRHGASRAGLARSLLRSAVGPPAPAALAVSAVASEASLVHRMELLRRPPAGRRVALQLAVLVLLLPWGAGGASVGAYEADRDAGRVELGLSWRLNPVLGAVNRWTGCTRRLSEACGIPDVWK